MFCVKCGEVIPDGSEICPICGESLKKENDISIVCASQNESVATEKKGISKKTKYVIGAVLVIALIFTVVNEVGKASLKKTIQKEWLASKDSLILVLDISNDEMEYRIETGYAWLDTTVATFDYKVVSANKIKVNRYDTEFETFKVEFSEDKSFMTVTPAITSTDDSELWIYLD